MSANEKKKKIDKYLIKQVLTETNGNIKECMKVLRKAGYVCGELTINRMICENPELLEMVDNKRKANGRTSKVKPADGNDGVRPKPPAHEEPRPLAPPPSKSNGEMQVEALQVQDQMLREDMAGSGFKEGEIDRFMNYSDFIARGFERTVDFTYGVAIKSVMQLEDRANWISENILQAKDDDEGGRRYSQSAQLEWQKIYVDIMEQIGKFATITNNAALIRVKSLNLEGGKSSDGRKGKRLVRKPKHPAESAKPVGPMKKREAQANVSVVPAQSES